MTPDSPNRPHTTRFHVEGMDCPDEIAVLLKCLRGASGISDLSFNLMASTMAVTHDRSRVTPENIVERVATTGMRASVVNELSQTRPVKPSVSRRSLMGCAFAGLATAAGAGLSMLPAATIHHTTWPAAIAYLSAIAAAWRFVLPKAVSALRRFRLDMNVLMTIAVIGAVALGQWLEASTVAFLFMVSHLLESWSVHRARRAILSLMELSPPTARVLTDDDGQEDRAVEKVVPGSRILVRPGEKFPLDGRIIEGETRVDQAPVTGESVLVPKQPGDEVYAGTVNQDGAITVEVTKPAGDTVLAGVIRLIEQAQSRQSVAERFVDRFARVYTPVVVACAAGVCLVPPLLFGGAWADWVYRSLVLLVIACPCALVISTPVSIVSALAAAARNGVLIKGGEFLEAVGRAGALAFDKTGTLTLGRPVVDEVIPVNNTPTERLVGIAAAIERRSEHVIARAIVEHAAGQNVQAPPCHSYEAIRGKGAKASVNGETYLLGNHRLLEENNVCADRIHRKMMEHEDCRHTTVGLASTTRGPLGVFLLADELRPDARDAVAAVRALGVHRIVMLTGDNEGTARAIAKECGHIECRAQLLPADKVAAVEELARSHGTVVMVGDGINDAPALAAATVGVAMGTGGTDAALETADIALMADDLGKLPWLLRHSRATRRIIVENVAFSLGIKVVFLALAIPGLANLWMAVAADAGASLLVTFNGLRLLRRGARSSANET